MVSTTPVLQNPTAFSSNSQLLSFAVDDEETEEELRELLTELDERLELITLDEILRLLDLELELIELDRLELDTVALVHKLPLTVGAPALPLP